MFNAFILSHSGKSWPSMDSDTVSPDLRSPTPFLPILAHAEKVHRAESKIQPTTNRISVMFVMSNPNDVNRARYALGGFFKYLCRRSI